MLIITQLNTDNKNFDLIAVSDGMNIRWRKSLSGYAITTGKVADKIIAVAVTDYSFFKGKNSTYKAYVIDPKNGEILTEKVIYEGAKDVMEFPVLMVGAGSYFKLGIRQTALERKVHTPLPGPLALFSMNTYSKQYWQTKTLTVMDFNEKLEQVGTLKPIIYDAPLLELIVNTNGGVFACWLKGGHITVDHYLTGQSAPSGQLASDLSLRNNNSAAFDSNIRFFASETNKNVLYYGLMYKNEQKDNELGLGKLDFTTGKTAYTSEVFSKDHVRELEKAFVPLNTKMDKPDLGGSNLLDIRYLGEANGKVVTAVSGRLVQSGPHTYFTTEGTLLINGYDTNLKQNFGQLLPSEYTINGGSLPSAFHIDNDKLYVIANDKNGPSRLNGLYGILNLGKGKWEKMEWLSKKKIGNTDFSDGNHVLWFADSFILPYCSKKGLMSDKLDVSLQQNEY